MKFKLNKKATLGFFAEPENEKEELVVKISDEMINKSSEALEKNKWRGWSTYEERQRGIDIVKEAIAPIVEKYKTELQDEEIFNMLYDHNEDNNYHTENTALQELLGKESLPQVSFTKQSDENKKGLFRQDVLFKVEPLEDLGLGDNDVVAWFVSDPTTCYAHMGQHSNCDPEYMKTLEDAKFDDYKDLLKELESIGYEVHVLNKDFKMPKTADEQDYIEVTKKGYKYEQLSDEAKEKVRQWLNQEDDWSEQEYKDEFSWILESKFKEYGITLQDIDYDFDSSNRCTEVDLKEGRKYWPAFKNILVECAKQVLKDLPTFKDKPELLEDWATEAASDMYYDGNGRFETYSGLVDLDGYDGYGLSYKISDLCDDAYENKIKPVLEEIRNAFEKAVNDHIEYQWSDEYAKEVCDANEYLFDENGNLI